jgi:hypothetical protein
VRRRIIAVNPEAARAGVCSADAELGGRQGFARLREDGAPVVMIDVLEREALMQEDPETLYITAGYP